MVGWPRKSTRSLGLSGSGIISSNHEGILA
jgi:hypothetical protein